MHGIDMIFVFHFYIDVFEFAVKLIITQFQFSILINIDVSKVFKDVKMPFLYDSFTFDSI